LNTYLPASHVETHLAPSIDVDQTEYDRFLDGFAASPGAALAYHHPFYLRFLTEVAYPGSAPRLLMSRSPRGRLTGVLPAVQVITSRLNVWLSLAYFGPNAGAIVRSDRLSVVDKLVRAAESDALERGCGSLTLYTPLGVSSEPYRRALGGVDFELPRESQWMALPQNLDVSPWPAKVRYYARRAALRGVAVRAIADERELDVIWDIYRERCELKSIPIKPRDHIRTLFRTAGRHGIFLLAEHDGRIVAGLICLVGGGVMSYYLPCARSDARHLRPSLLLLDRAVAIGRRDAGCRVLNFEASPKVGGSVYQFKTECGGKPVSYRVLVKLLRPGILDEYRAIGPAGLRREVPEAFIVPFDALT